ncbi:dihydropyrimidinase [Tissierella praeacuta DSM 18095]|uniref:D-hydantoinase n=1 Tax=Tissierella praeacuta DSM 18095 TaxID=1123404 RepID=A0A1M4UZG3_9FIRM|nr:dihydropyrimidinase [Tissierella praeacuta]TCU73999.1 dihydropyrimidinase [Tissierella praeacuta]SHE62038.1 dihydropyrimidinase [Tissierella praeacuta DSM 18095]SUP02723.1 D-hydantoinase [Tissierella praeacuta]
MGLIIKNGNIITSKNEYRADILVEGEQIIAIGRDLDTKGHEVVDATGKYVFPGGVDEHVHYNSFNSLGYETSHAALVGGTTTVGDFVVQPVGVGLKDSIINYKRDYLDGVATPDYVLHGIIMDPCEESIDDLVNMPSVGVSSVKLFMAYKGMPYYVSDEWIFKALCKGKQAGVTIMVHAENADIIDVLTKKLIEEGKTEPKYFGDSRPVLSEAEATSRAIYMAKIAEAPIFVVHVTNQKSAEIIRDAYNEGLSAYGETCTHYLMLSDENLAKPNFEGAKYVCNPPLRPQSDVDFMWEAINKGWLLSVGSDHCAIMGGFSEGKRKGINDFSKIPPGSPGVQDRLYMMWTYGVESGKISRQKFVEVCCTMPAKICGIYPQKGDIMVGSDADIVIFDPNYQGVVSIKDSLSGSDYCTYEGYQQKGIAEKVFLRGKLVAEGGKFVGELGKGKQVMSAPYAYCYEKFKEGK